MAEHNELGKWGEAIAIEYLEKKGYIIIEHDWHSKHKDIDIIAQYDETIVFIEVKTRSNTKYGEPIDAVDYKKMKNIKQSINHYVKSNMIDRDIQFDIIGIVGTPDTQHTITHYEDIYIF